jgi:menaquinone-dependent protoporphyrinogen oxidase
VTRVLVSAASRHGATAEIADAIAKNLRERGMEADSIAPERVEIVCDYDAFVIGSALYAGHWLEEAVDLCQRLGPNLGGRPVWLFSSGPVGPPDGKFTKKMWTEPVDLEEVRRATGSDRHRMLAGKLVRGELSGPQRAALFFFKRLDGDYRDWQEVASFTEEVAAELGASQPDPSSKQEVGR